MKEQLLSQFQSIIEHAGQEDLSVLANWMNGLEKKQNGELNTYLSAGLHMKPIMTEDSCTVSIPITPFIHNTFRMPHGGILGVILDTAMGVLANYSLNEGFGAVTTNLSVNFLATAYEGNLHATAKFAHKGRQTMVVEGVITDDNGKRLAIGTGSFFVIAR